MMILPAVAAALMAQASTKEWTNPTTDIKLKYPSAWAMRRDKYVDELKFEISGKTVRVELTGIEMNFPPAHWQDVMREINTNNNRTVLRQWEEELLGVPVILTRVRDTSKSEAEITVTGLLMSVRPQKFMYRLYAPEGVADEAEKQWSAVLLTADSVSGKLPSEPLPVDPNGSNNNQTSGNNTAGSGNVQVLRPQNGPPKKTVRGPFRVSLDDQRGTFLYLPNGWQLGDSKVLNSSVEVAFGHGLGDAKAAESAWLKVCGQGLSRLDRVTSRTEPEAKWFSSGYKGTYLERKGIANGQEEIQWVAYGSAMGFYFTYSWTGTESAYKDAKDRLLELLYLTAIAAE